MVWTIGAETMDTSQRNAVESCGWRECQRGYMLWLRARNAWRWQDRRHGECAWLLTIESVMF